MRANNKFPALLIVMVVVPGLLAAHVSESWPANKAVYVQGGPFAWHGAFDLRMTDFLRGGFSLKAGIGKIGAPDYYGNWYQLATGYLSGKKSHHLEFDLGPGYFITNSE